MAEHIDRPIGCDRDVVGKEDVTGVRAHSRADVDLDRSRPPAPRRGQACAAEVSGAAISDANQDLPGNLAAAGVRNQRRQLHIAAIVRRGFGGPAILARVGSDKHRAAGDRSAAGQQQGMAARSDPKTRTTAAAGGARIDERAADGHRAAVEGCKLGKAAEAVAAGSG